MFFFKYTYPKLIYSILSRRSSWSDWKIYTSISLWWLDSIDLGCSDDFKQTFTVVTNIDFHFTSTQTLFLSPHLLYRLFIFMLCMYIYLQYLFINLFEMKCWTLTVMHILWSIELSNPLLAKQQFPARFQRHSRFLDDGNWFLVCFSINTIFFCLFMNH